MIDTKKILIKSLPPTLIINNFIDGLNTNYEKYVIDFINHSKLLESYDGEPFALREHNEQSNKECDAYNSKMELEIKLLVTRDYMEETRRKSIQISSLCKGVTMYSLPEHTEPKTVIRSSKIFYDKTKDELERIYNHTNGKEEGIIRNLLNKVVIEKNIIFFLPYKYYNPIAKLSDDEIKLFVEEYISKDYKALIDFRNDKVRERLMYMSFIIENKFVIAKAEEKLKYVDQVNTNKSKIYQNLEEISRHL